MKSLVTGGAGFIGSNLVDFLVKKGHEVIVLDNLNAIKRNEPIDLPSLPNMMFVKGDVRSDIDLKRVFREKPTIVYHLAAFFANQNSVDYPENSADVDINGIIKNWMIEKNHVLLLLMIPGVKMLVKIKGILSFSKK